MAKKENKNQKPGQQDKKAKKGNKSGKGGGKFLLLLSSLLLIAMGLGLMGVIDYGAIYDQLTGKTAAVPKQAVPKITGLQPQLASPQGISTIGGFEVTDAGARKVARIYEQMRPENAAETLKTLPPGEAVKVLIAMDEWRAGIILSKMDANTSANLTAQLATAVAQKEQYDKMNSSTSTP